MDQMKKAFFCKRIKTYNETFAPVGGGGVVFAFIWDDSVAGRTALNILSTFHEFVVINGHYNKLRFWLDNCSSQNKFWNLILHMILLVNSGLITTSSIELIYFEKGHTFMSADSFHHQVEKEMKRAGKVHNFNDFKECVQNASNNQGKVVKMAFNDFFEPELTVSSYQVSKMEPRVMLQNIKRIVLERGTYNFSYSDEMEGDLKVASLLNKTQLKKVKRSGFQLSDSLKFAIKPVGIESARKENILKNLAPLMPHSKADYWINMPVSSSAKKAKYEE